MWVAWSFHVRGEMLGQWQETSVGVKCWQKRGVLEKEEDTLGWLAVAAECLGNLPCLS